MEWTDVLIGRKVVAVDESTMTLDNGVKIRFDDESDCCSYVELASLATTNNVITAVTVGDNEEETGGEGPYRAWVHVVTEACELNIVEQIGDASNGYYLHGFSLGVTVTKPEA